MSYLKFLCFFFLIFTFSNCSKDTGAPGQLSGHWMFYGYLGHSGDTSFVERDDCDSCLSLFINTGGRANYIGTLGDKPIVSMHVQFKGNTIIRPDDSQTSLPYYGPDLEAYVSGVQYPGKWFVQGPFFKLISDRSVDTLLFKLKNSGE